MAIKQHIIEDFSGGIRKDTARLAANESSDIQGMWHQAGDLQAMGGTSALDVSDYAPNSYGTSVENMLVKNHFCYTRSDGKKFLLAKRGRTVWVGVPEDEYRQSWETSQIFASELSGIKTTESYGNYQTTWDYVDVNYPQTDTLRAHNVGASKMWSSNVLTFDGVSSYLSTDNTTDYNIGVGNLLICAWIKVRPNGNDTYRIIQHRESTAAAAGYGIFVSNTGRLGCGVYEDVSANKYVRAYGTKDLRDGNWHHVAAIYEDPLTGTGTPIIYVDGALDTISVTEGVVGRWNSDTASPIVIGRYNSGTPTYNFCGEIGGVAIYDWGTPSTAADMVTRIQTKYEAEKWRYLGTTTVNYSWYPLYTSSFYKTGGTPSYPNLSSDYATAPAFDDRSKSSKEAFAQVGDNVYFACDEPGSEDKLMCWEGQIWRKGYLGAMDGDSDNDLYLFNNFIVANTEYYDALNEYLNNPPVVGDTVFLKDESGVGDGEWIMRGHMIRAVANGASGYPDSFMFRIYADVDLSEIDSGNFPYPSARYCIVRVRTAGLDDTRPAPKVTSVAGGSLATGAYNYVFRYGSSRTGYYSNASPASDAANTTGGTKAIRVYNSLDKYGWQIRPKDHSIDTFELYRSVNAGQYKQCYSLALSTSGTYSPFPSVVWDYRIDIPTAINDTRKTAGTVLDLDAYHYARPPVQSLTKYFNNRLYGAVDHKLHFSTLNNPEYWPTTLWDYQSSVSGTTLGGYVPVGSDASDKITGIVAESGTYDTTGIQGGNLLVFTKSKASRWFGKDWSDFTLEPAFAEGCWGAHTLVNAGGLIIWCNGDHIMMVSAGGNVPQIISKQLWPRGIKYAMTATNKGIALDAWSAVYWQNKYVLSGSMSGSTPDTTWIYDIVSGTWTSFPAGYNDFCVWQKPGATDGEIITGSCVALRTYSGSPYGDIDQLFSGDPNHTFSWTSAPIYLAEDALQMNKAKTINRITACFLSPQTANQSVSLTVYADGDTTTAAYSGSAQTLTANANGIRRWVEWSPRTDSANTAQARFVQLKLSGTLTKATRLEWVLIEFVTHDHHA